jgi:thiamine biosynthesis protein ThiI
MKEMILCKYGEIVLKGLNKGNFENQLLKQIRVRVKKCGDFTVRRSQSTVYVEPNDENADIDAALAACKTVFGIVGVTRAAVVEKDLEQICDCAKAYLPKALENARTFKVEAKRADKRFPFASPAICQALGGAILSAVPRLKVDVHNPDVTVRVEIREENAFLHAGQQKGAGGMPVGSAGKAMLLLSGGIDSPVAGYLIAKRGATLEAVHFESAPYTSERAKEKVLDLARQLTPYCTRIRVHVISLTEIQETLMHTCEESYFTLLLRRFMMRLAERTARRYGAEALITGESLGQVASQTMQALGVTDAVVNMPVFRPCIGMDKEEIVRVARQIGTFETSILPFEDCCTVFTPRHPRTKPELEKVQAQEAALDIEGLQNRAFDARECYVFDLNEE